MPYPSSIIVQISTAAIARMPGAGGLQDHWPLGLSRKAYKRGVGESDRWKRELELLIMASHSSPIVRMNAATGDSADGSRALWIGTAASSQMTGLVHGSALAKHRRGQQN